MVEISIFNLKDTSQSLIRSFIFSKLFLRYYDYSYFREMIRDYVPFETKVLVAGCGNSNLPGDMVNDGYEKVVCGDLSRVVIDQLRFRYKNVPEISYFQGTMTDTDLPMGSFGAVIDKALFDTLLCTQTGPVTVSQYVNEVMSCSSFFSRGRIKNLCFKTYI